MNEPRTLRIGVVDVIEGRSNSGYGTGTFLSADGKIRVCIEEPGAGWVARCRLGSLTSHGFGFTPESALADLERVLSEMHRQTGRVLSGLGVDGGGE